MKVRRYLGNYPKAVQKLKERGLLLKGSFPKQKSIFLLRKAGVDIIIRFQRMDPTHFSKNAPLILEAAYQEALRYEDVPDSYRYAQFEVDIWDEDKKKKKPLERTFPTENNPDSDIMVYGAPGWEAEGKYLSAVVDIILDIPRRYRDKMRSPTYKVKSLKIGIRVPVGEAILV